MAHTQLGLTPPPAPKPRRLSPLEETKRTRAGRAITLGVAGGPIKPRGVRYEKLSREGYQKVMTIYACINEICSAAAASTHWYMVERGRTSESMPKFYFSRQWKQKAASSINASQLLRDHEVESGEKLAKGLGPNLEAKRRASLDSLDEHPLLALLDDPNEMEDGISHVFNNIAYYLVSGNSYTEIVSRGNGEPLELWNHRPDRMSPEASGQSNRARGIVARYVYEANGQKVAFKPNEIIHRRMFNPLDDFLGLSPLQVAYAHINNINTAVDWNTHLLKNGMRPTGALVTEEYADEDVYERTRAEIESIYSGAEGAGRPLLLEGGMKWVPMSLTPMEVDWIDSLRLTRSELCALYNVPPEIIGAEIGHGKSYNSYLEARKALYEEAVIPHLDRVRSAYNRKLASRFGDRYALDYDRDLIDAIQEERDKMWNRVRQANWISVNEKRDLTGYDPIEHQIADIPTAFLGDSGDVRRNARLLAVSDQTTDSEANAAQEGEDPVGGDNAVDGFLNDIGSLAKPVRARVDEGEEPVRRKDLRKQRRIQRRRKKTMRSMPRIK